MKRYIVGLLAALSLVGAAGGVAAQETLKLRLGYATSPDGPGGVAAEAMVNKLEELSGGAIELELFPAAQLGGEVEMLTQVRSGTLDMAILSTPSISAIEPAIAVVDLPYIWESSADHWETVNGPIGDELLDRLEQRGIKGLAWGSWGGRGLVNNGFDINEPSDLKGKHVRVIQSEFFVRMVTAFGAHPAPIAWPEVYTALQQKAVDSVDVTYWAIPEANLDEVGTSLTVSTHVIASSIFLMNQPLYESLSDDQKEWLTEAAATGGQAKYEMIDKATDDAIEGIRERGLTVTEPEREAFASMVQPVYDYYIESFGDEGADFVRRIREAQK